MSTITPQSPHPPHESKHEPYRRELQPANKSATNTGNESHPTKVHLYSLNKWVGQKESSKSSVARLFKLTVWLRYD